MVVVTGASAGVGRAAALAFAKRGAALGLIARGHAGLTAARAQALENGAADALVIPTDVSDADAVEAAAARVEAELGPIDVWVNNAMASVFAYTWDVTAAEFKRVTEVTYLGFVNGTLAALKRMRTRDSGTIVQVGSSLAYRSIPLQAPYCASKHAVAGFTDSLRVELRATGSNVRISQVNLPAMNTPQFGWVRTRLPRHPQPVPPIYQPEVGAEAIVRASETGQRMLDVGLITVATRWGDKFIPRLLDHYLARKGVDSQQTSERIDAGAWKDNLAKPLDDTQDRGAHGIFDDQAKSHSWQAWAASRKPAVLAVGGAVLALATASTVFGRARR
ncbi:SDR family oxidoreductase [Cryptosporangium phraense]|uniref:SDR family oxidoreductase n=1 Tax=Cryptosporangium phraense TaxID=2593070 RepID=UPI00197AEA6D|nr:SDR family oxidoreductase [Cryptosporangium phraense]